MMEDEEQHLCHICPAQQIYENMWATEIQEECKKKKTYTAVKNKKQNSDSRFKF